MKFHWKVQQNVDAAFIKRINTEWLLLERAADWFEFLRREKLLNPREKSTDTHLHL